MVDNKRQAKILQTIRIQQGKDAEAKIAQQKAEEKTKEAMKVAGKGHVLKYSAIGDSLTAGYAATSTDKAFINRFSSLLIDNMGFDVKTTNNGLSGAILSYGLTLASKVNEQTPDLITIEFGTNDGNNANRVDPKVFETQLNQLLDDLTINAKRDPLIALLTTWNVGSDGVLFNQAIYKVGEERHIPVIDISSIGADPISSGPAGVKRAGGGVTDAFHPNDVGMDEIAKAIDSQIEPLLFARVTSGIVK